MSLDVLAFGAHPDDVDLGIGGTLLHLAALGYTTGIVDMTRGEMGTRGTPEIRAKECQAAAGILGAKVRENLELPDGRVTCDIASKDAVIRVIRKHRPRLVLSPIQHDLHPDHAATGRILKEACFLSGLAKWDTKQAPHRPHTRLGYFSHHMERPSIVIDITPHFARKKEACLAFQSQFHNPNSQEPATYISRSEFWNWWEARARSFGHLIGAEFGEAFVHEAPIPVRDPIKQFEDFGYYPESSAVPNENPS